MLFFCLIWRLRNNGIDAKSAALLLDKDLEAEYTLITYFELSQDKNARQHKSYVPILKNYLKKIFENRNDLTIQFVKKPAEVFGLIFFTFLIFMLNLTSVAGNAKPENSNQIQTDEIMRELMSLQVNARIAGDENLTKILNVLKDKILSGKFPGVDELKKLENDLNSKIKKQKKMKKFINETSKKVKEKRKLKQQDFSIIMQNPDFKDLLSGIAEALENQDYEYFEKLLKKLMQMNKKKEIYINTLKKNISDFEELINKQKKNDTRATYTDNSVKNDVKKFEYEKDDNNRSKLRQFDIQPVKSEVDRYYAHNLSKIRIKRLSFKYQQFNKSFRNVLKESNKD